MKRYLAVAVVLCAVSVGLLAAQTGKPAADDPAVQADRALGAAFEKGNSATVNKLLDAEFTWIDTDGIMWDGVHGTLEEGLEFLQKPYTRDALILKIREVLDASQFKLEDTKR